jgi:predicted lipoprotein with Yx(FWY)xxD motif
MPDRGAGVSCAQCGHIGLRQDDRRAQRTSQFPRAFAQKYANSSFQVDPLVRNSRTFGKLKQPLEVTPAGGLTGCLRNPLMEEKMKRILLPVFALALTLVFGTSVVAQDEETTTVAVAENDELGEYLTDGEGMTLYLFTNDTEEGVSTCVDVCLTTWPIFTAEEPLTLPEGVEGELTLIEREDGTSQVAYNGIPLYYFTGDQNPGDTTGNGIADVPFAPGQGFEIVKPGAQFGEMGTPVASPDASPVASREEYEYP